MASIAGGSALALHSVINPRKMTPITCLLSMMLIWSILFLVAPIEMYASPNLYPYLILGSSFAALLIGLVMFEPRSVPTMMADKADRLQMLRGLYRTTYFLGLCGIAFRIIDWVAYRHFSVGLDFAENLAKVSEGAGNPFSSVAVFLVPFTVAPYMFYAVARRNGEQVGHAWTAAGLAILWPILTLLLGSRSSMFMQVGMLVIARVLVFPRFPKKAFWIVLILFLTMVHIAGFIFIERITQYRLDIDKVVRLSAFTQLVPSTSDYYSLSHSLPTYLRSFLFIDSTMTQYFLHGVPEFVYQVEHYTNGDMWGGFTFTSIARILSIISGSDYNASAVIELPPRLGTYTTLFGPFYIDFGPLTPLAGLLIGAFISFVRRKVLLGSIVALPLYCALTMQILAAVVVNTVNGAYGIFYDLAFLGLWIGCAVSYPRRARLSSDLRPRVSVGPKQVADA